MTRLQLLAALAVCALTGVTAMAGGETNTNVCVAFTDIRGLVTVNGQPTPGVKIEVLCCDSGQPLNCTNADPFSTGMAPANGSFGCVQNPSTNYLLSFNNDPAGSGGFCFAGCSVIPGMHFGCFAPWAVSLRFSFNGCTQTVSCADVSNAYAMSITCGSPGMALINVNIPCGNTNTGCTTCVDPALGLGAAAGSSVLELGASSVSITGPAGGILGDISIAPNGKLSMSGSEFITGTVKLGAGATFNNSSSGIVGGVQQNVDLSAQIAAAYAANLNDAALPCSQNFVTLDGKTVTTIVGVSGVNVICVKDISLSGKQITLVGPADAKFIFNITGKLVLTGGGDGPQIRVDQSTGLKPSAVLYNLIGSGQDVAFSGGGGGVNCCAAIVDGSILAPYRKIALSPGLVNGEILSGLNISIVSGSSVRCPPCPPNN
jgi:hypothetical protein